MSEIITDPEAAAEATAIANGLADVGRAVLSLLGFEMTKPANVQIHIGTEEHPNEARITLTWPLPSGPPLWAEAAKAHAAGKVGPPPRRPQVRPESDYEMRLPGEKG